MFVEVYVIGLFNLILLVTTGVVSQDDCPVTLEAENGVGGEEMQRSEASGNLAVLLKGDEKIAFYIALTSECDVNLYSLRYSNDGSSETVQVSINDTLIGSFRTLASSNYGHNWNIFYTETIFQSKATLKAHSGSYIIEVFSRDTDKYGIEIDKVSLQLQCVRQISGDCPVRSDIENESGGLSAGAIVGIVFGVLGCLIAIPGAYVALKTCCGD